LIYHTVFAYLVDLGIILSEDVKQLVSNPGEEYPDNHVQSPRSNSVLPPLYQHLGDIGNYSQKRPYPYNNQDDTE
jgi:hypothetical protein